MDITLALTADVHGWLPRMPEAEVGVVSGDVCPDFPTNHSPSQFEWFVNEFLPWADEVPTKVLLVVWGNHDWLGQEIHNRPDSGLALAFRVAIDAHNARGIGPKVVVLTDDAYVYTKDGVSVRFYGIPWVPSFHSWAFMMDDTDGGLGVKYQHVPILTDVLIAHGPPELHNNLSKNRDGVYCGSVAFANWFKRHSDTSLKMIVCGHIHEGFGLYSTERSGRPAVDIYNVALCGAKVPRLPMNHPILATISV